jgi:hypothetical protein
VDHELVHHLPQVLQVPLVAFHLSNTVGRRGFVGRAPKATTGQEKGYIWKGIRTVGHPLYQ